MMKTPQPNSAHCFVCGVENPSGLHLRFFDSASGGEPAQRTVEADYTVPPQFQGYSGIAHGGIIAAMLDEVASRVYFRGDPPRMVVTARMDIRYRKPVPVGRPLRLVGKGIQDQGRVCKALGQIYGEDGTLLAEADLTLMEVPVSFLEQYAPLDLEGWKVYSDEELHASGAGEQP